MTPRGPHETHHEARRNAGGGDEQMFGVADLYRFSVYSIIGVWLEPRAGAKREFAVQAPRRRIEEHRCAADFCLQYHRVLTGTWNRS